MKLQRNVCAQKSGERAIDLLAQAIPELSRQQLKQAMQKGAVWLKQGKGERRLKRVTQPMQAGAIMAVYYDDDLLSRKKETAILLADEGDYTIWIKPAGMLSQGTKYGDHCSLLFAVEQYFQPRRTAYLVHRLDSGASGLMLVAHTSRAAAAFSEMFQQRQLTKRYRVVVEGLLDINTTTLRQPLDDKEAVTHIENIVHTDSGRSELVVLIETGRKHQIRRHLAGIGHPVIGDKEYGSLFIKEPLQLAATELSFVCPLINKNKNYFLP